jgi:hypothetical protein
MFETLVFDVTSLRFGMNPSLPLGECNWNSYSRYFSNRVLRSNSVSESRFFMLREFSLYVVTGLATSHP